MDLTAGMMNAMASMPTVSAFLVREIGNSVFTLAYTPAGPLDMGSIDGYAPPWQDMSIRLIQMPPYFPSPIHMFVHQRQGRLDAEIQGLIDSRMPRDPAQRRTLEAGALDIFGALLLLAGDEQRGHSLDIRVSMTDSAVFMSFARKLFSNTGRGDMHIRKKGDVTAFASDHGETIWEISGRAVGGTTQHSVAHVTIDPGKGSLLHFHPNAEESFYILSGAAKMVIDGESRQLGPGQLVAIPAGRAHQILNAGECPLEFLAICVPAWRPEDSVFI
jgi:mannose-6-phosphate isomerase-like protein (cupin superfamily)